MSIPHTHRVVVPRRGLGQDRAALDSSNAVTTLVLADGAGGQVGGRQAAELCTTTALQRLRQPGAIAPLPVLTELDHILHAHRDAGESTLVLAQLVGHELRGASVGDSGAWLIGESGYEDLTEGQTRKPMLGSGLAQGAAFTASIPSETLLIASDGLLKFAAPTDICSIVRSATELAGSLGLAVPDGSSCRARGATRRLRKHWQRKAPQAFEPKADVPRPRARSPRTRRGGRQHRWAGSSGRRLSHARSPPSRSPYLQPRDREQRPSPARPGKSRGCGVRRGGGSRVIRERSCSRV